MFQSVTDRVIELDGHQLQRHNEGHWDGKFQSNPDGGSVGFSSFNDAGVECETGEFLYSMVRMLKPEHVLETGTHWGVSAAYMGLALNDNGAGHLDTFEFLPQNHFIASQRIDRMRLNKRVECHYGDIAGFTPEVKYKLIFLDTEPQTRFAELEKFWESLEEGGFVFIHDLHRHMHQIPNQEHGFAWPFGPVGGFITELVVTGKARPFHFSTPRGITGFYKVSSDDYKWN